VLSAYNLANATAVAIGALVGSQIFSAMDRTHEAYAMLFVFSTAGRMAALWWLRRGI